MSHYFLIEQYDPLRDIKTVTLRPVHNCGPSDELAIGLLRDYKSLKTAVVRYASSSNLSFRELPETLDERIYKEPAVTV